MENFRFDCSGGYNTMKDEGIINFSNCLGKMKKLETFEFSMNNDSGAFENEINDDGIKSLIIALNNLRYLNTFSFECRMNAGHTSESTITDLDKSLNIRNKKLYIY